MEDTEQALEEGFDEPLDDKDVEPVDPNDTEPPASEGGEEETSVESIEAIIAKTDGRDDGEDPILSLGREERLEPLAAKVEPPRETEFVCKRCFLVKHQSQLADKKRHLCRDCA